MKQIPIQIQGGDPVTIEQLEMIVKSVEGFAISKVPSIVIIDVRDEGDLEEVVRLIESGSNVFLTSKNADSQLLMKAMNTGVKGFFQQPLDQSQIIAALEKFKEQQHLLNEMKPGQVITIIGSKGGVGTTTIAVNLAVTLAKTKVNSSVCLVDLNLVSGDAQLFLDMQNSYNWGEVIRNIERLDSTFLMNILSKHSCGVHVLAAPVVLNESLQNPQAVNQMLTQIQRLFDFVVIDGGPKMNPVTLGAFEVSTEILLVSNLNILSLASTTNLLRGFMSHGHKTDKLRQVINRQQRSDCVTLQQAEEMLSTKVFWSLPEDKVVASAINNGTPLIEFAPRSHINKGICSMADNLFPEENTDNKKGGLSLFRR